MKNSVEKVGKFRFKINFSLSLDAGASHSLNFNELPHRAIFVLKDCQSVNTGL